MSLKSCPKCGNKLEPNASYCDSCGADLRLEQSSVETPTTAEIKSPQTPKMASDSVQYADFLPRLIAIIIDGIIVSIIGSSLSWIINPYNILDPWGFAFNWLNNLLSYLIGFVYFWALESYNKGQTLGKMAMKLRTVDANTLQVADPGKNAINNLAKPSGFLILDLIIGVLTNSGDPQKRIRILQNISDTVVIVEQ
ncbi:MAG: RDD family protein [Promethearchaeota archaeon]|jgi:uncharacterized RDD family membrane protein YckC